MSTYGSRHDRHEYMAACGHVGVTSGGEGLQGVEHLPGEGQGVLLLVQLQPPLHEPTPASMLFNAVTRDGHQPSAERKLHHQKGSCHMPRQ
jgi:hypothetical protein